MNFTGHPTKGEQREIQTISGDGWRVVSGFESYQINQTGEVRRALFTSNRKGKPGDPIKSRVDKNTGYRRITLWKHGKCYAFSLHRLVALAFLGTPPTISHEVSHIDGDKSNNHFKNLKWETRKENHFRKKEHGTSQCGSRNGMGKLTESQVLEIKKKLPCNMSRLAREYGVSHPTISKIASGDTWKHVTLKELI